MKGGRRKYKMLAVLHPQLKDQAACRFEQGRLSETSTPVAQNARVDFASSNSVRIPCKTVFLSRS